MQIRLGPNMGKGPKHNSSKPRNNGIFKVAGQNFKNDKKGKPKEVTSKLKLVGKYFSTNAGLYETLFRSQEITVKK